MQQTLSKAQFKAQALEYLRAVENKKQPLIITHAGKPVVKIIPYKDPDEPVGLEGWEVLK